MGAPVKWIYAAFVLTHFTNKACSYASNVDNIPLGGGFTIKSPSLETYRENTTSIEWYLQTERIYTRDLMTNTSVEVKSGFGLGLDEIALTLSVSAATFDHSGTYFTVGYGLVYNNENDTDEMQYQLFNDSLAIRVVGYPEAPEIEAVPVNSTSIKITVKPGKSNGCDITSHNISYIRTQDGWDSPSHKVMNSGSSSIIIRGLDPYTDYQFKATSRNCLNDSIPSSPSGVVKTNATKPTAMAKLECISETNTSIRVQLSAPDTGILGEFEGYNLRYRAASNPSEDYLEAFIPQSDNASQFYPISKLAPYRAYNLNAAIKNNVGEGPFLEEPVRCNTEEGIPSKPTTLTTNDQEPYSFVLRWNKPDEPNGVLKFYIVQVKEQNSNEILKNITVEYDESILMKKNITELTPHTRYHVSVRARTDRYIGEESTLDDVHTDVGPPSICTGVSVTANDSDSLRVDWQEPMRYDKEVSLYNITIQPCTPLEGSPPSITHTLESDHNIDQMIIISGVEAGMPYCTTIWAGTRSRIHESKTYWSQPSNVTQYTIKANGKPGGGVDTGSVYAELIAGVICAGLVLVLVILAFVLVYRKYIRAWRPYRDDPEAQGQGLTSLMLPDAYVAQRKPIKNESNGVRDSIPIDRFADHVANLHIDGDLGFSQEYEDINKAVKPDLTFDICTEPENRPKNRYNNIFAYDHTRVILKPLPGKAKSDFINANFIDGYHGPKAYIAAQGPLPSTFADFWRMVWEQNSAIICMITNLTEKGRRKCDQYWPMEGEHQYGNIVVRLLSTTVFAHYIQRTFSVRNTKDRSSVHITKKQKASHERIVTQFHYTDWPDHGVPSYTLPVLQYVRKSAAGNPEGHGPPIVHCSAGVGRTGTYITIDSMMRQCAQEKSVNIFSFLVHIRHQRNHLVQTEDQYIFTHDALLEHIESGDTEVREAQFVQYCADLATENDEGNSLLLKQFTLATRYQPQEYDISSAIMPINADKNRNQEILPVERSRVRLPIKPGTQGSDYINASYLQGYNSNDEFIVTQHPLASTTEDFWRMVWDKNCMTIVFLSHIDDEQDFQCFWPDKDEKWEYEHFTVSFSDEIHQLNFVIREFLLVSTQDDYQCITKMISTSFWPEMCTPTVTVFDLVQAAKKIQRPQNEGTEGEPNATIVIDRFGGAEAGTFCALSTLFDQLQEGSVDVYMAAKLYHLKRPNIFKAIEDYHFLYKAIESLLQEDHIPHADKDSGIGNCHNYNTLPASISRSVSHNSTKAVSGTNDTSTL